MLLLVPLAFKVSVTNSRSIGIVKPLQVETTTPIPKQCHFEGEDFDEDEDEADETFAEGEEQIDLQAEDALRSRLIDGPISRSQALKVVQRMQEILNQNCNSSRTLCRRSATIDMSARNLLRFMTGDDISPPVTPTKKRYELRDEEYCDSLLVPTERYKMTLDAMKNIIQMKERGLSEKTIQAKYRRYKRQYYPYYKQCVERSGSRFHQFRRINGYVLERFRNARANYLPVHDRMLVEWGRKKAVELGVDFFKGASRWVHDFKRRNRIASHKITRYSSRTEREQQEEDQRREREFREEFQAQEKYYPRHLIWNTDQTRFDYEITNQRTLSWVGERTTTINVDSKGKLTHSYTSQPTISRDGKLIGKLLLVVQETNGTFGPQVGPRVAELERRYGNIIVRPSKNGMLNKTILDIWLNEVMVPSMMENMRDQDGDTDIDGDSRDSASTIFDESFLLTPNTDRQRFECEDFVGRGSLITECATSLIAFNPVSLITCPMLAQERQRQSIECSKPPNVLLIADSWPTLANERMRARLRQLGFLLQLVPPRLTPRLQPLDIGFMRQYKKFFKRIVETALHEGRMQEMTTREAVINLHSLIYNQFQAPVYQDMFRYAWHNTDRSFTEAELDKAKAPPRMVQDIQFEFDRSKLCEHNCSNYAVVRCSHCGKLMCLHHFVGRSCFHQDIPGPSGQTTPSPTTPAYDDDDDDDMAELPCRGDL